ncbi:hypothetical protein [Microvirga massiliensis]|uniref:hypothetical protein n=1 Tax=Microvirga massiliensis TaxID=1033741 RepID=UPI00062B93DB|nr:hypothetical protein [Microvirga massiliensis]
MSENAERKVLAIPRKRELPPPAQLEVVDQVAIESGWGQGAMGEGEPPPASRPEPPVAPTAAPKKPRAQRPAQEQPAAPVAPLVAMPMRRRKQVDEPTMSFTARVSIRSGNAFIEWCHEERISYREGFDYLMDLLAKERAGQ